jgi:hypothetical protein
VLYFPSLKEAGKTYSPHLRTEEEKKEGRIVTEGNNINA